MLQTAEVALEVEGSLRSEAMKVRIARILPKLGMSFRVEPFVACAMDSQAEDGRREFVEIDWRSFVASVVDCGARKALEEGQPFETQN